MRNRGKRQITKVSSMSNSKLLIESYVNVKNHAFFISISDGFGWAKNED